jgi:hypothetical protein
MLAFTFQLHSGPVKTRSIQGVAKKELYNGIQGVERWIVCKRFRDTRHVATFGILL